MQNAPEPFGWGAEIRSGLNAKRPAAGAPGANLADTVSIATACQAVKQ